MVTCLWMESLLPSRHDVSIYKYEWRPSDNWRHLWCGHFSTCVWRTVWCCSAALSAPPQIIAQEQKSHSSQVSRPPISPSLLTLHHSYTVVHLCACEDACHTQISAQLRLWILPYGVEMMNVFSFTNRTCEHNYGDQGWILPCCCLKTDDCSSFPAWYLL